MEIIGDYEIPDGWTHPLADGGEGADVIVFGTPAYFYSCTRQPKMVCRVSVFALGTDL